MTKTELIQKLRKRSDIHWQRKVWHVTAVFIMFLIFQFCSEVVSFSLLVGGTLAFVSVDIARQRSEKLNEFMLTLFGPIMRQSEADKMAGTTYLLSGVLIIFLVFHQQRDVVALTLLFLAFADPMASYIGIRYGKEKIFRQKTLQGFLAAFFVCFVASLVFLFLSDYPMARVLVFSLVAGLVGALAELVPIGDLDDNLTLPILSAVGIYILFYFFGFLA